MFLFPILDLGRVFYRICSHDEVVVREHYHNIGTACAGALFFSLGTGVARLGFLLTRSCFFNLIIVELLLPYALPFIICYMTLHESYTLLCSSDGGDLSWIVEVVQNFLNNSEWTVCSDVHFSLPAPSSQASQLCFILSFCYFFSTRPSHCQHQVSRIWSLVYSDFLLFFFHQTRYNLWLFCTLLMVVFVGASCLCFFYRHSFCYVPVWPLAKLWSCCAVVLLWLFITMVSWLRSHFIKWWCWKSGYFLAISFFQVVNVTRTGAQALLISVAFWSGSVFRCCGSWGSVSSWNWISQRNSFWIMYSSNLSVTEL